MKRSLGRSSIAFASVTLLTLVLAAPAHAISWDVANHGVRLAANWANLVRSWIAGGAPEAESGQPAAPRARTPRQPGKGKANPRPAGDTGVCTDPDGNRVTCPT